MLESTVEIVNKNSLPAPTVPAEGRADRPALLTLDQLFPKSQKLDFVTLATTPPPPLDFSLPGIIAGTTALMVSPGGVGKTYCCQQIITAVGAGVELWHSFYKRDWSKDLEALERVDKLPRLGQGHQGPVLALNAEDPLCVMEHRYHSYLTALPADDRDAVVGAAEDGKIEFRTLFDVRKLMSSQKQLNHKALAVLEMAAQGRRLIIIDTLRTFHDGEENSNDAMSILLTALTNISKKTHCTILVVHHAGKGSAAKEDNEKARGASAIVDNGRGMLVLCVLAADGEAESRIIKEGRIHTNVDEAKAAGELDLFRKKFVRMTLGKVNYSEGDEVFWYHRGQGGVLYRIEDPADFAARWRLNRREEEEARNPRPAPPVPAGERKGKGEEKKEVQEEMNLGKGVKRGFASW